MAVAILNHPICDEYKLYKFFYSLNFNILGSTIFIYDYIKNYIINNLIMNIKSSQTLVSEALDQIKTISTDEAHKMVSENQCNLIDIREIRALEKEGRVENSQHIPRGMLEFWLDPESVYFKEGKLDLNKEMVLFCAGGLRSALAAKSLKDMGFEKVSHIDGGFGAIKQSKFKIV